MTTLFWRQSDIVKQKQLVDLNVNMIGCGGIGSPTVLALVKMGVESLNIFDNDKIEPHNIPNQFFRLGDIGAEKTVALGAIVNDYTGITPNRMGWYKGYPALHSEKKNVIISGVDSMDTRQKIWKSIKNNPKISVYVDGRMGAQTGIILSVRPFHPGDIKFYESYLFDEKDSLELPCTARAIIYNVFVIAGLICNQVRKFAVGEVLQREIIIDLQTLMLSAK